MYLQPERLLLAEARFSEAMDKASKVCRSLNIKKDGNDGNSHRKTKCPDLFI